jgi:hypothetical protein
VWVAGQEKNGGLPPPPCPFEGEGPGCGTKHVLVGKALVTTPPAVTRLGIPRRLRRLIYATLTENQIPNAIDFPRVSVIVDMG